MPVTSHSHDPRSFNNQECLETLPNVLWRVKSPSHPRPPPNHWASQLLECLLTFRLCDSYNCLKASPTYHSPSNCPGFIFKAELCVVCREPHFSAFKGTVVLNSLSRSSAHPPLDTSQFKLQMQMLCQQAPSCSLLSWPPGGTKNFLHFCTLPMPVPSHCPLLQVTSSAE